MKFKLLWRNIVWAMVIFILCSIPGDELPGSKLELIPYFDKMVHFGMFFIMAIFLFAELKYQTKLKTFIIVLIVILLITIYGGTIEYLQQNYFVNRSGDYLDLTADVAGGVFAIALFPWLKKQKDQLLNRKPFSEISFLKKIL